MPERKKWFCKTQKYELQLLPVACCFHKNELELFREDWHRRPPRISRCLRATRLSATVIYFFYFFSIFCAQYISVSLPTTYIHSLQHIQFGFACCQNATLSSFFVRSILILSQVVTPSSGVSRPSSYPQHSYQFSSQNLARRLCRPHASRNFSFKAFSAFHQSSHFLPASAGHILPAAFLPIRKPEPRAPACRPLLQIYHTYLTYKSQTLTFGSAGQHYFNHQPFPRRPPPSSDASGLPPFPSTLPQPSTPPISHFFFFFFLPPFFFFSFFFFLLSPFSFFSSLYYF